MSQITASDLCFYQVSDKVSPSIIKTATQNCEKEDCCLSARITYSTCVGVKDFYDKNGNHIIEDKNEMNVVVTCRECWMTWMVDNDGNILDVYRHEWQK